MREQLTGRSLHRLLAGAALALLAAGCGWQAPARQPQAGGFATWSSILSASRDLGPVDSSRVLSVNLVLRQQDPSAVQASVDAIYDPGSPSFGRYLSPGEYDARFGPRPETVERLRGAMEALSLEVVWTPGSPSLTLSGRAAAFERALGVLIDNYQWVDGRRFFSSREAPSLPEALRSAVEPVARLTDWMSPVKKHAVPVGGLRPSDIDIAYDTKPLRERGIDGTGETVVIWALSDGFKQADLDAFNQKWGLPPIQPRVVGPAADSEGEVIMDVEAVHSVAPGASIVVYTGGGNTESTIVSIERQMVNENPGAILTQSWGGCEVGQESYARALSQIFDKANQMGETAFFSSGDSGGYECLDPGAPQPTDAGIGVSLPAALPQVTAVGGTLISLSSSSGWHGEAPWKNATMLEGTGGGISTIFPRPSWQRAYGVDNQYNKNKMRSVPDVSAVADGESGLSLVDGGRSHPGGGTSLSSPLWAGMTALINQSLKKKGQKPVGFFNPTLYAIYSSAHPPAPAFHDIKVGGNFVYPAVEGYDMATGLGTPDVAGLAEDVSQYQRNGGRI